MTILKEWFGMFVIIFSFQVILSDDGTVIMEHSIQREKEQPNTSLADFFHQTKMAKKEKNTKSTTEQSLLSQFDNSCTGKQPCTCYYPDHSNVTIFELSTDATTQNASGIKGTGPGNCQDLQQLGYTLMGFYMVRFNSKRVKTIYCEFNGTVKQNNNKNPERIERALKHLSKKSSKQKMLRFCGGVGHMPCNFYYSENPDVPLNSKKLNDCTANNNYKLEPRSCEDLRKIGYFLKGFYTVRFNAIKVKIVYCEFEKGIMKNGKTNSNNLSTIEKNATGLFPKMLKNCPGVGSQPCSCYFSNSPNILQYELSSDEITRNAANPENCKDLKKMGHFLDGFYMARYSKTIMKIVFCKFDEKNKDHKPKKIQPKKPKQVDKIKEWLQVTAFLQTISNPVTDEEESTTDVATTTQTSPTTTQTSSTITETYSTTMKPAPKVERPGIVNAQPSKSESNQKCCSKHYGHVYNKNSFGGNRNSAHYGNMRTSSQYKNKGNRNNYNLYPSVDMTWQAQVFDGRSPYGRRRRDNFYYKSSYLLKNNNGKCLELSANKTISQAENVTRIIQSNCKPRRKWQLWIPNENRICNYFNKCLSLPVDWSPENLTQGIILSEYNIDSPQQKWQFRKYGYIVSHNHCLEVTLDSKADGSKIKMGRCNSEKKSQLWYFEYV